MKLNKEDITNALVTVMDGVAVAGVIPEMLNINYADGKLISYSGPLMLIYPIDLGETSFSVSANKFANTVKTMPAAFEMEITDAAVEFHAKGKKSKTNFGITLLDGENRIIDNAETALQYIEAAEFHALPSNFMEGVRLCMFSAASTSNLGTLSCLSIEGRHIVSSDNLRISCFIMDDEMDSFLLPVSSCTILTKFAPTEYHLHERDNTVFFKNAWGSTLYLRVVSGEYPDYKAIALEEEFTDENTLILPDILAQMVRDVGMVNSDVGAAEQYITLSIAESTVTVATTHTTGWGERTVELDYAYDTNFSVSISCPALLEIMKHTFQVQLTDNKNRLIFGTENYRHILPLLQEEN